MTAAPAVPLRPARRWFHYSKGVHLPSIMRDGSLRCATAGVMPPERPAVWFSCRETFEPTAMPGHLEADGTCRNLTVEEAVRSFGPLVRFEVSDTTAAHTWVEHVRLSRISPRMACAMTEVSREQGADPLEWRLTYHDVQVGDVLAVEASLDGAVWWPAAMHGAAGWTFDRFFVSELRRAVAKLAA